MKGLVLRKIPPAKVKKILVAVWRDQVTWRDAADRFGVSLSTVASIVKKSVDIQNKSSRP